MLSLSTADDRECANLTVCGSQQYVDSEPTATSDRACVNASDICPRGRTGRTILIKTVAGSNVRVDSCVNFVCLFVCCDVDSVLAPYFLASIARPFDVDPCGSAEAMQSSVAVPLQPQ